MKRYAKPMTDIKSAVESTEMTPPPPMSEISIARLIDDGLVALHREMKNLLTMSAKGKLDSANAKDLRDHMKLLFELNSRENESLRGISDEELKEQAKVALSEET